MDYEAVRNNSYVKLCLDFLPLFMLAFSICMLKGLRTVKAGYMGKTLMSRFVNLVLTSVLGAALSVGCAAILPLVYPAASESVLLGATVVMTVGGIRLVDAVAFRHFGIHLVDGVEAAEWAVLSDKDKREAMRLLREYNNNGDK